ncbi:chemotaxis protein PomA [Photobacterium damselae subsp. piscicida]|nr:chemotaxis protein PomA [Photobacterium damselae subsp. piscicida]
MDLATLIGMLGAFAFIVMAMLLGGSLGMFFDVPSVLIVFGGTTFVVLMKYSIGQFLGLQKLLLKPSCTKRIIQKS